MRCWYGYGSTRSRSASGAYLNASASLGFSLVGETGMGTTTGTAALGPSTEGRRSRRRGISWSISSRSFLLRASSRSRSLRVERDSCSSCRDSFMCSEYLRRLSRFTNSGGDLVEMLEVGAELAEAAVVLLEQGQADEADGA